MGWINTLNLWKVEYGIVESIGFWTFSNDNWIIVIRIYSLFVKNKSRIKFMEFIEVLKLMYSTMINKKIGVFWICRILLCVEHSWNLEILIEGCKKFWFEMEIGVTKNCGKSFSIKNSLISSQTCESEIGICVTFHARISIRIDGIGSTSSVD